MMSYELSSSCNTVQIQVNMDTRDEYYENICDDDFVYAEIRKQILLLTTDDDDDFTDDQKRSKNISSSIKRNSFNKINACSTTKFSRRYYDWTENEETNNAVPNWISNLWKINWNINGTGVFIPHINVRSRPRRNNNYKPSKCFVYTFTNKFFLCIPICEDFG